MPHDTPDDQRPASDLATYGYFSLLISYILHIILSPLTQALARADGVGVDWVTSSCPTDAFNTDPRAWDFFKRSGKGRWSSYSSSVPVPGLKGRASVQASVTWVGRQQQHYLSVSTIPSRWIDPFGHSPCPFSRLLAVIEQMFTLVERLALPAGDIAAAKIKRLDVARDFRLDHPGLLLSGLERIPQPKGRKTRTWRNGSTLEIETLYSEKRNNKHKAKYAPLHRLYAMRNTHETAHADDWRLENQLDNGRTQRWGDIDLVGDITEARLVRLLAASFIESQWGTPVLGTDAFTMGVEHLSHRADGHHLKEQDRNELVGWAHRLHDGLAQPLSRHLQAKVDHATEAIGHPLTMTASTSRHRLDLLSGREVIDDVIA